jgi:uncharacterized protein (DUF4213/DUF364 family)
MWELYDELIEKIPGDITAENITIGLHWTIVAAGKYCGTAMTVQEHNPVRDILESRWGQPLKYLASLAKSWNFVEASIGVAAINAYYNNKETWKQKDPGKHKGSGEGTSWKIIGSENAFEGYGQAVKNKKVAIIGHFRHLENYMTEAKQVSVLERRPVGDDYPDSACEYILPEQDYVFITGTTMTNKTLPRLLQLSESAHVILVGPSTPMTPILFRYGVDELSGFLVGSKENVTDAASMAGHKSFFQCGDRVRMIKKKP